MRGIVNTHGSQESNIFPIAVFLVIESIYRSLYILYGRLLRVLKERYILHTCRSEVAVISREEMLLLMCCELQTHQFQTSYFHSLFFLFSRCGNKNVCDVPVDSSIFGDPCPGTFKYIEVHYACRRGEFFQLFDNSIKASIPSVFTIKYVAQLRLSCDRFYCINVFIP